jgi:hypothetical protein
VVNEKKKSHHVCATVVRQIFHMSDTQVVRMYVWLGRIWQMITIVWREPREEFGLLSRGSLTLSIQIALGECMS